MSHRKTGLIVFPLNSDALDTFHSSNIQYITYRFTRYGHYFIFELLLKIFTRVRIVIGWQNPSQSCSNENCKKFQFHFQKSTICEIVNYETVYLFKTCSKDQWYRNIERTERYNEPEIVTKEVYHISQVQNQHFIPFQTQNRPLISCVPEIGGHGQEFGHESKDKKSRMTQQVSIDYVSQVR